MRIFIVLLFVLKSLLNHSQDINKIDSLINNGIKLNAYPGAQLFLKKVILNFINHMVIILMILL